MCSQHSTGIHIHNSDVSLVCYGSDCSTPLRDRLGSAVRGIRCLKDDRAYQTKYFQKTVKCLMTTACERMN